jgi:hypothetical protein
MKIVMDYNRTLITVRHLISHNKSTTTAPQLFGVLLLMRKPEDRYGLYMVLSEQQYCYLVLVIS